MNRVLSCLLAIAVMALVPLVGPSDATACDGYGGDVFSLNAGCPQAVVQQRFVAPQAVYRQAFVAPAHVAPQRVVVQRQRVQQVRVVERRRLRLRSPIVFRRERVVLRH